VPRHELDHPAVTVVSYAPTCPYFEDLEVGQEIEPLVRGPLLAPHLMRWSAATENWHRIHYDQQFTVEHEGLQGLLINGSWKQHFLLQVVRQWCGNQGWVWRADFQFRAMNVVGETLTAWGRITDLTHAGPVGLVGLDIGIRNETGTESTPGTARVVVPHRGEQLPTDRNGLLSALDQRLAVTG
jgi:acyl dehydratase